MIEIEPQSLLADLRALAEFGKVGTGVDRTAFTPQDIAARHWLRARMREAGLESRIDDVGNVYGESTGARQAVVIGSHTDTVPKGGWLDGAMGVIFGLAVARAWNARRPRPDFGVDVISFADEEGTYLPCVGSRAFCDDVRADEIAAARAKDGRTLKDAVEAAGFRDPRARFIPARHVGFLEAHIEQGPVLEAQRRRIGVVTGIVGIRRFRVSAVGQADHAGTTPMAMRADAGAPLYAIAARVHAEFPKLGAAATVWNVGTMIVQPGAANVVPASAEMVVEFRDLDLAVLDRLERHLLDWVAAAATSRVAVTATPIARIVPTAMTPKVQAMIAEAAREAGEEPLSMPSGAGHDAMICGRFMPAGMLFIPSIGGRSHDIAENTSEADIILGCRVLAGAVERMARA